MAGEAVPQLAPPRPDFILFGQKLEKIGFIYDKGRVIVSEDLRVDHNYSYIMKQ